MNRDISMKRDTAFQWKTSFKPDRSYSAQEVIISRKISTINHTYFTLNSDYVQRLTLQKCLGWFLTQN